MNIIFQIGGKLITPSEDADTILRGITKKTVLEIARNWGVEVEERQVSVEEIILKDRLRFSTKVLGPLFCMNFTTISMVLMD